MPRAPMMVLEDLGAPCSYDGARGLGMPRAPMMVPEDLGCPVLLRWCSSSRSAPLLLCPRRACSLELTRRRRASAEPRARRYLSAPPTLSSAHRSCRRAQRAPFWPHRRAPTDVIPTFSSVATLPSPRLFTRTDTTTARERRAASTSLLVSAADLVERAPIVSSCAACAVLAAPPRADRRHPHVQLRCCSALAAPVHSN